MTVGPEARMETEGVAGGVAVGGIGVASGVAVGGIGVAMGVGFETGLAAPVGAAGMEVGALASTMACAARSSASLA